MPSFIDEILAVAGGARSVPDPSGRPCPHHPDHLIELVEHEKTLPNGTRVKIPLPVCRGGGKPHGFKVDWLTKFLADIEKTNIPERFEVSVTEKKNIKEPSEKLPPGVFEMKDPPVRDLILPKETKEGLDRVRRRIEHGRRIFNERELHAFTVPLREGGSPRLQSKTSSRLARHDHGLSQRLSHYLQPASTHCLEHKISIQGIGRRNSHDSKGSHT